MDVRYAFQQLDDLPAGYAVPEGRVKPWGTCHAVLPPADVIDGPFAVINADDYYGPEALPGDLRLPARHPDQDGCYEYAMVGYPPGQHRHRERPRRPRHLRGRTRTAISTASPSAPTSRRRAADARYTEDDGDTWTDLPERHDRIHEHVGLYPRAFWTRPRPGFPAFLDNAL